MTEEAQLPRPEVQGKAPKCPSCAALPRLAYTMLDPIRGRTVRLYQCLCGERIWEDWFTYVASQGVVRRRADSLGVRMSG
ncbi:hypothetical protein FBZ96_11025 [Bradyrhizobium stylosanthis]|uniref:Uncharacterized protein n=1 Tax=Bradyrhizobium stylosanthis TaxID=1803665 RepID=A0A560D622_9BRAD|nr:hypothetical protein FBZ96_11025 [Bradyrhizobium stylosanthis]